MITQSQSNPIRASYENSLLPSLFSTWLTGKPLEGQTPLLKLNWFSYTFAMVILFLCSLAAGFLFFYFDDASYWILASSWFGLIFSSRRMAAVVLHQAVHNRLSGVEKVDFFVGELVTVLMFSQDYMSYKHDHCVVHYSTSK